MFDGLKTKKTIIVFPWLPIVSVATIDLVGDSKEFKVWDIF